MKSTKKSVREEITADQILKDLKRKWKRIFILGGSPGAGKTTFLYHGLHELTDAGHYDPHTVESLSPPKKTEDFSRVIAKRTKLSQLKDDYWIDLEGEKFIHNLTERDPVKRQKRYLLLKKKAKQILSNLYLKANIVVLVCPSEDIIPFTEEKLSSVLDSTKSKYRKRLEGFSSKTKIVVVVSQSADSLAQGYSMDDLKQAVTNFAHKTSLNDFCDIALLCDSNNVEAANLGTQVATLDEINATPEVFREVPCSAGVAMSIIMEPKSVKYEAPFVVRID